MGDQVASGIRNNLVAPARRRRVAPARAKTFVVGLLLLLHNVLRSSNVIEVGQIFFCHQPNFANDCNGLSYGG